MSAPFFISFEKRMKDLNNGEVKNPSALEDVMRAEEGTDEETPKP